jgi:maltooligosyltrehalose synthase
LSSLAGASIPDLMATWEDGRIKMELIRRLLHYRRAQPDLFVQGSYTPLSVSGPNTDRFVCFVREHEGKRLVVVALRRMEEDGVTDLREVTKGMTIGLPEGVATWRDVLTDTKIAGAAELQLDALFGALPVVVLTDLASGK